MYGLSSMACYDIKTRKMELVIHKHDESMYEYLKENCIGTYARDILGEEASEESVDLKHSTTVNLFSNTVDNRIRATR